MTTNTQFSALSSAKFATLVGNIGKSNSALDAQVNEALQQSVYLALAHGDTSYADRLSYNLPTHLQRLAAQFIRLYSNLSTITKTQRKKAHEAGKPIAETNIWQVINGKAPQTHTPELKAESEARASKAISELPFFRDMPSAPSAPEAKPYAFNNVFGQVVKNLSDKSIKDEDTANAQAFLSYVGMIQQGVTMDALRAQIIADYEAQKAKAVEVLTASVPTEAPAIPAKKTKAEAVAA